VGLGGRVEHGQDSARRKITPDRANTGLLLITGIMRPCRSRVPKRNSMQDSVALIATGLRGYGSDPVL